MKDNPLHFFSFRLAEHLGYPHPDYLLPLLSGKQFLDWLAYFSFVGPPGNDRYEINFALLNASMLNAWRDGSSRPLEPAEFMPYLPEPTPQELWRRLKDRLSVMRPK